jgi:hypothetical protein
MKTTSVVKATPAPASSAKSKNAKTSPVGQRRTLIVTLIDQLDQTINVSNRKIKQALTADEYAGYQPSIPRSPKSCLTPENYRLLKLYHQRLSRADALFAAAEKAPRTAVFGMQRVARQLKYHKAEAAYESAYEALEQLGQINELFDRDLPFLKGGWPEPEPEDAPRLIGSRSRYALKDFSSVQLESIKMKRQTLQASLRQIDQPQDLPEAEAEDCDENALSDVDPRNPESWVKC